MRFKPKTSQIFFRITEKNIDITDPKLVANAFNNYFTNVGNNLANQIRVQNSPLDYLKSPSCSSFCIFPVTADEIETDISSLKSGKATGPFSIPINVLKIFKKCNI